MRRRCKECPRRQSTGSIPTDCEARGTDEMQSNLIPAGAVIRAVCLVWSARVWSGLCVCPGLLCVSVCSGLLFSAPCSLHLSLSAAPLPFLSMSLFPQAENRAAAGCSPGSRAAVPGPSPDRVRGHGLKHWLMANACTHIGPVQGYIHTRSMEVTSLRTKRTARGWRPSGI
jgi:hypothetical protein